MEDPGAYRATGGMGALNSGDPAAPIDPSYDESAGLQTRAVADISRSVISAESVRPLKGQVTAIVNKTDGRRFVKVRRDTAEVADEKPVPVMGTGFEPQVNDWVIMQEQPGGLVVIGKEQKGTDPTVPEALSAGQTGQSLANAAQLDANSAQGTANTATTKANTAQSTANAADTRADDAYALALQAWNGHANHRHPIPHSHQTSFGYYNNSGTWITDTSQSGGSSAASSGYEDS